MPRLEITGEMQVSNAQMGDDGWSMLVKLEIQMLRELVLDYSQKAALLCHRAKLAVEARGSVSTRFKALLTGTTLGRTLFTAMKEAADAAISPSSLSSEVRERAELIRKSGVESSLAAASPDGNTLLDVVCASPGLAPALLKTQEAMVQLPGTIEAGSTEDSDLVAKVVNAMNTLVKNCSADALKLLADGMAELWHLPLRDERYFKHMDVFLHVLIATKVLRPECVLILTLLQAE